MKSNFELEKMETVITTFFSQSLLYFVLYGVYLSSGQSMFYLKLVPSINYTGSDFGKGESWEEVVGTSQQRDGNCTDDKSVSCSCGRLLSEDQGVVEDRLKATCAQYENIEDQSDFSFCTESLERAGFEITKESVDVAIPMVYTFNESMLNALLRDMEDQLRIFKMVLDRTVSGILAESNTAKCFCFDRYKEWLCTVHLPFYGDPQDYEEDCDNITVPSNSTSSGNSNVVRLWPCIETCHNVLQNCPYYLPSRYQPTPSRDGINGTPKEPLMETIYGGYPAFDCPRRGNMSHSPYESDSIEGGKYLFHCLRLNNSSSFDCVRGGSTHAHDSSRTVVAISILFLILVIRTTT